MSNNAASILRELIGKEFNVNPKDVLLSGELSPGFSPENTTTCWSGGRECNQSIYGFNHKKGWNHIEISSWGSDYPNLNGVIYNYSGETLAEGLKRLKFDDNYFFIFLIIEEGKSYGEETERYIKHTLYKSPNFAQYWTEIEEKDIIRWKSWLEE